jgi:hypothetical protein
LLHAVDIEGIAQRDLAAARKLSYSTLKSRVQKARVSLKRQIIACCDVSFDARHQVVDADPAASGAVPPASAPARSSPVREPGGATPRGAHCRSCLRCATGSKPTA